MNEHTFDVNRDPHRSQLLFGHRYSPSSFRRIFNSLLEIRSILKRLFFIPYSAKNTHQNTLIIYSFYVNVSIFVLHNA